VSIALVTDSTADIPDRLLNRYPIFQVPAVLVIDGTPYRDGEQITREAFYSRLPDYHPLPTTASPSVGDFQDQFEHILAQGFQQILAVHAASTLSGIYNASRLAAESFPDRVRVIDSRQLSFGLGFQVLEAAQKAAAGFSVQSIADHLADIRPKIHLHALLDTFDYIHRSGRVSWVKARLGGLLKVKPLVELRDGAVLESGLSRARTSGVSKLLATLERLPEIAALAVLHTDPVFEDRDGFLQAAEQLVDLPPLLVHVTTVIGTHVGPHGLGFAAMVK
jgi:DegV family protein with EDD domain